MKFPIYIRVRVNFCSTEVRLLDHMHVIYFWKPDDTMVSDFRNAGVTIYRQYIRHALICCGGPGGAYFG